MLDTIVASGRRLGSLVNDILDFSKLRNHDIALSLRAVDAKRMIDIVMALSGPLARDKPVLLRVEAADDLPLVLADENRLQQILHNLIGNAIKFTREGQVCIKASVLPSSLQISVADTGIGIPADRLDSIFDSFNQGDGSVSREFGGTGLGLSITRKLVELHGGSLLVESAPGKGSVFSLTLPLAGDDALLPSSPLALTDSLVEVSRDDDGRGAAPESAFVARESSVSNGSRPSQWVLVVDDEAVNRQVLRAQLGSAGFGVIEAPGGQEALDILGSPQAVDLVLLDVMMPRVSGYDVCRELRKTRPAHLLPVVFLTAKTQTRDILEGFAAGGNDYLLKPFSRDELLARLRIHLELLTTWRIISDYSRNLERRVDERTRELVMAQQALVSRQKASALGVLTAGVAHEINNPNNFVMAGLQNVDAWRLSFEAFVGELLDADADPEIRDLFAARFERLAEQLAVIQTGSQRINAIVAGLRVVTRLDEADQKPVDVVEGIENIIMLLAPSWAGQVIFSLDVKARPVITCWPGELNQVFMNIVLNACHAIAAGRKNHPDSPAGRVDIVAKYMPMDASHPGFGLSFRDDGEGMSPDVLARAFDPFFTTREVGAGAGLGLSIARDIVERHAGVIRADASPGKGCEVVVVLPLNSGE